MTNMQLLAVFEAKTRYYLALETSMIPARSRSRWKPHQRYKRVPDVTVDYYHLHFFTRYECSTMN